LSESLRNRFEAKVDRSSEHYVWTGSRTSDGVGKLTMEFRASMIASNLRRTTRLLMLALGEDVFRMILAELPMLLALGDGRLPDEPGRVGQFEIEITPDRARAIEASVR
jgi:hypothetical protein